MFTRNISIGQKGLPDEMAFVAAGGPPCCSVRTENLRPGNED
jgi:hypothetical protein